MAGPCLGLYSNYDITTIKPHEISHWIRNRNKEYFCVGSSTCSRCLQIQINFLWGWYWRPVFLADDVRWYIWLFLPGQHFGLPAADGGYNIQIPYAALVVKIWTHQGHTNYWPAVLNYFIHDDVIKWKHFRVTGLCAGNSPVNGEFPTQRPVTRSFYVFFYPRLNQQLSQQ